MDNGNKSQPPVTFTLDGVEYTVEDRRQAAKDVIRLGGLDPADYGGQYLSLFTGPTPVV